MARIHSFDTKDQLTNDESLAFGKEIEAQIQQENPVILNVTDDFAAYRSALQTYNNSLTGLAKSKQTSQLHDANEMSNYLYSGIKEQICIATRHFDLTKKAAAIRLMPIINTFSSRQNLNYADQISFIYNFINELTSDSHKRDLEMLGLTAWITKLKIANERCAGLLNRQLSEKPGSVFRTRTISARNVYEHAYEALVERFNALALVYSNALYENLFVWWNACIDRYQAMIPDNIDADI